ncbi:hypothetical protein M413DRAFT_31771 [Hebeloma cylindrosporum]|uniref:NAD-dependent epimerase/dehydratase domain-containing protein n=1 Tax=Hebeloma cylindrosporum TaxID=76867 RepID=A0A0C2Y5M1_HEBCY|nr:hypothetical protein M413DRAFT_31771 [Hebeloma cylindrosporum h7]
MSGKLVLVTGVTGFVAGHLVEQLLQLGFRVRGTARAQKIAALKKISHPSLEFVEVNDLAKDDLTRALHGVDIVIHVAAPLPGKASIEETINTAVEGTLNVVRQVEKAGITKIVVTGTYGSTLDPSMGPAFNGITIGDFDWGKTSKEEIYAKNDPFYTYFAAKLLAEKALWEFVKSKPHLDVTSILPGFVFGPWAKLSPLPASEKDLGTNSFPYMLLAGVYPPVSPPWVVDIRDVAKAHVLALDLPHMEVGTKRFLVNAGNFTWEEAAEHLRKSHPGLLKHSLEGAKDLPGPASYLDTSRAKEVLGIKEFIDPKKMIDDVVDDLIELQKRWASAA